MRRGLVVLALLAAVLVGGDRLAAVYAAHRVAQTVATTEQFGTTPDVAIHGFPFLTQLVRGTYDDVEVTVHDLRQADVTVDRIEVHMRGARVPFGDVLTDDVRRIPVDRLDGSVHVTFAELSRAADAAVEVSSGERQTLRVSGTVDVAGVAADATATARVNIEGERVDVVVEQVEVAGEPAPAAVAAAVRDRFSFAFSLPDLPFDVSLRSVETDERGITIAVVARNVTLRAPP